MRKLFRPVSLLYIFIGAFLCACAIITPAEIPTTTPLSTTTPLPSTAHLRISNSGKMDIKNLTVLFPEDQIKFGEIYAGSTTEYLNVPSGVYGYAAYQFEFDGQLITQSVTDWVGEVPLAGINFTYTIDFNSNRPQWGMVKLIEVVIDE